MRGLASAVRIVLAFHVVLFAWVFLAWPAIGFVVGTTPAPNVEGARVHPDSRIERVGELWHVHLAGTPLERGFACGSFTAPMMAKHEGELFTTMESLVPWFGFRHLILGSVTFNNRGLEGMLEPDERDAIAGIALGYREAGDRHAHVGPAYARILGYHALHDASQYLIDNPLVNAPMVGCSAACVTGERTVDGHVLTARLFDFEGGRSFDTDKVVYTIDPGGDGLRYVHVAWGGIHGAVTGMNEAGLWLSVNAGITEHLALSGRPLVVAIHRALETCRTIDEAVEQLRSIDLFVSESVLIASSAEPDRPAVVLELSPAASHVRAMEAGAIAHTNHFEHAEWEGDDANARRIAEGTTSARRARLAELLDGTERHTPESLLEVMRDRKGTGGRDLGFGHRSSINAWIGAHLVVADLTEGVLWVAEPSHGLGRAHAFDVDGPRPDIAALPASPDLAIHEAKGRDWKSRLEEGRRLTARRDTKARAHLESMIADNPAHPDAYALLALVATDEEERETLLRAALDRAPAYASERRAIETRLAE